VAAEAETSGEDQLPRSPRFGNDSDEDGAARHQLAVINRKFQLKLKNGRGKVLPLPGCDES